MPTFDVAIVGGGPAGSTCAWKLRQAGMKVVVVDRAVFPRDKVCAGWITPQVMADLELDEDDYRHGRRFQAFTGFRVGVIGAARDIDTIYGQPISVGIRRCEFDHYLLERSGARLQLGNAVSSLRRDGGVWTINDALRAPMLVGAGGHFCPVSQFLNGSPRAPQLVAAQEGEFPIDSDARSTAAAPELPELFFSRDLKGYGWCVRKQDYVNVGFGHLSDRGVRESSAEFASFLHKRGRIPSQWMSRWRGHAYLLSIPPHRKVIDDGVLLAGDAAGLAYPQSGEGIRPAIESGLMAAETILEAHEAYSQAAFESYDARLRSRFGSSGLSTLAANVVPAQLGVTLGLFLLRQPQFVRHIVLNRWFLHAQEPPLTASGTTTGRARLSGALPERMQTPTRSSTAASRHRSA
ncbi:MAG: NAD(P)/FAD-dependent oxidoreductase [Vicinamibacterales bacterium]